MILDKAKEIFGIIDDNYTLESIRERFRNLAKVAHPDLGGSNEKMAEIAEAYRVLKRNLKKSDISKRTVENSINDVQYLPGEVDYNYQKNIRHLPENRGIINVDIEKNIKNIKDKIGNYANGLKDFKHEIRNNLAKKQDDVVEDKNELNNEIEHQTENNTFVFDKDDMFEIIDVLNQNKNFRILKDINPKFLNDYVFMMIAIEIEPKCIYYASDELKSNKEFVLDVFDNDPEILSLVNQSFKDDKDFILKALEISIHTTLKFANRKFYDDFDVIKKAVSLDGLAYKYASYNLKNNKEIILTAIKQNDNVIDIINPSSIEMNGLYSDEDFIIIAIKKQNDEIINHSDELLWNKADFVIRALNINKKLIEKVNKDLFNNAEFVKKLVEIDDSFIKYIGESLKDDVNFALYFVNKNGLNLGVFSSRVRGNKQVVEKALSNNVDAFIYAMPGLALDQNYLNKIAKKIGMGPNKSLYEEKTYLKAIIKCCGFDGWEKAEKINQHVFDIDILTELLRNSDSTDIEKIYYAVKQPAVCKYCHKVDGDTFKITVNGNNVYEKNNDCKGCGGEIYRTDKTLVDTFLFEYKLAKGEYHNYNSDEAQYILKRADDMGKIDFNILSYFPIEKRSDSTFMKAISDKYGVVAANYYEGNDKANFIRQCVKKYGLEALSSISPEYLSDSDFIILMIRDYGIKVLDYVNLDYDALNYVRDKLVEIKNMEEIKKHIAQDEKPSNYVK